MVITSFELLMLAMLFLHLVLCVCLGLLIVILTRIVLKTEKIGVLFCWVIQAVATIAASIILVSSPHHSVCDCIAIVGGVIIGNFVLPKMKVSASD